MMLFLTGMSNKKLSDHFQVYCTINRLKPEIPKIKRSMRNFRNFDQSSFDIELQEKLACVDSDNVNDMHGVVLY